MTQELKRGATRGIIFNKSLAKGSDVGHDSRIWGECIEEILSQSSNIKVVIS